MRRVRKEREKWEKKGGKEEEERKKEEEKKEKERKKEEEKKEERKKEEKERRRWVRWRSNPSQMWRSQRRDLGHQDSQKSKFLQ